MNSIETIICLILLLMAVPDLCKKIGRPALANACFVVFGILLEPFVQSEVMTMLQEAGKVGFLLVLFEVGLEIDLPRFRVFLRPLMFAMLWVLIQVPVILGLAMLAGLEPLQAVMATAALGGCSMSMGYYAWKRFPGLTESSRNFVLQIMVALEMLTIILLAVAGPALERTFGWMILVKLLVLALLVFCIGRFASHVSKLFQQIIEKTTHWRVHFLVLLVLVICAAGQRLGLSGAKTAFFLGLFMSRAQFQNQSIEEHIAPISRRFLIPIFFVSLGLLVNRPMLFSYTAALALCGGLALLGVREIIHRRWLKTGGDNHTYLLFCPNLTMAALAAATLLEYNGRNAASWTLLTGLFMSIFALFFLPRENSTAIPIPEKLPADRPMSAEKIGTT